MMKRLCTRMLCCFFMVALALSSRTLLAAQPTSGAEQLVRSISSQLLTALKEHQGHWEEHQAKLQSIVERVVMPHVDLSYMAKRVVGRHYWSSADAGTRTAFQSAFKTSVIHTYSQIFSNFDGETVKVYPLPDLDSGDNRVHVGMSIAQPAAKSPVIVKYYFVKRGDHWLIYDFNVEDVSVLDNYHAQYLDALQSEGLAGLTKKIDSKNKENAP